MIIEHIVEQYAENASFLWHMRDLATKRPHYTLKDLCRLDERVEANLDGLRIAADVGWEIAKSAVANGEPGELFVATVMALERNDLRGIAFVLDASDGEYMCLRGIISALGWSPRNTVERIMPGLLHPSCPPPLQWLGIAGCAVNRIDPGEALRNALESNDLHLRRRAVKAVGELGRLDLRAHVEAAFHDYDEGVRFEAALSAALLGSGRAADVLRDLAATNSDWAPRLLAMAVRRAGPRIAGHWIESVASQPEGTRTAIVAIAALGDPTYVPWLLQWMKNEDFARLAAEAYSTILGLDLKEANLEGDAPEKSSAEVEDKIEEDVLTDPDEDLVWPIPDALERHWKVSHESYQLGERYLMGQPISATSLRDVLHKGGQRQRAAAAIELALYSPGRPLQVIKAPGFRQESAFVERG